MDQLVANLDTINNCSLELDEKSRYFASKKSTFSAYSFGSCATLSNFLRELQTSYTNTSLNIKEVYQVLDQFSQDVEALERKAAYGYGYVSLENVNSLLSGLATSIKEVVIDSANLFEIMSYDSALDGGILSGVVDAYFTFQSTRAVWVLSFLEGVLNIGEMIVDAGAMAVSAGASLLGFDDASNSINNFIAADWTREGYNAVVDKTGISDYSLIDPNGTIANLCSMGGTITGMIVISILTAGAGGAAAGAGAGAGAAAAGVTTSTVTTATLQAAVGAATALGSESEAALQNGATAGEAFAAGGIAAVVGALFGAVGGVFDDAARAATGVGEVVKNSLASFFVNTLEPLINEATNTLIYKNDGTGFWDNFTTNFVSDGVLLNMLLSGGTNAAGTAINGMIGLRANSSDNINSSKVNTSDHILTFQEYNLKMQEIDHLLENPDLFDLWKKYKNGETVQVYGDLIDDFNRLVELNAEIKLVQKYTDYDELLRTEFEGVGVSLENTSRFYTLESLLKVLMDEEAYQAFETSEYADKVSMANAIQDLMNAINKNDYDLGLSADAIARANQIVSKFSIDHYQYNMSNYLNNYQSIIAANRLNLVVLDSEYIRCLNNLQILLSNDPDNVELKTAIDKMLKFQDANINYIVSHGYELDGISAFNKFLEITEKKLNTGYISSAHVDYIINTSQLLGNHPSYNQFIQSLLNAHNCSRAFHDKVLPNFKTFMDGYVSSDLIDQLNDTLRFSKNSTVETLRGKNVMGFNNGRFSVMGMERNPNILTANTSHESLHQLSSDIIENSSNRYEFKSGVYHYISTPSGAQSMYTGFNESITEYFNSLVLEDSYPTLRYCNYEDAVDRLKIMVDNGIVTLEQLKQAYFNNDIGVIKDAITRAYGVEVAFDKFVEAFDKAVTFDHKKEGLRELDKLLFLFDDLKK